MQTLGEFRSWRPKSETNNVMEVRKEDERYRQNRKNTLSTDENDR